MNFVKIHAVNDKMNVKAFIKESQVVSSLKIIRDLHMNTSVHEGGTLSVIMKKVVIKDYTARKLKHILSALSEIRA